LLRSYLAQPDRRANTRQIIRSIAMRLGEHSRALRAPYVVGGVAHAHPEGDAGTVEEAQKAEMMFNAILALVDAHEELERRRQDAQRSLADAQKVRGDLGKSIAHGKDLDAALRKEQQRVRDLEERLKMEQSRCEQFEAQLRAMDQRWHSDAVDRGEHLAKIRSLEREWKAKLAEALSSGGGAGKRDAELAESRMVAAEERSERLRAEKESLDLDNARLWEQVARLEMEKRSSDAARDLLQQRQSDLAAQVAEARATAQHAEALSRERTNEVERLRTEGDTFAEDMARRRFQPRIDDLQAELDRTRADLKDARDRLARSERALAEERRKSATLESLVNEEHLKSKTAEPAKASLLVQAHERKRRSQ
jgi:chromosome segregation ATPase